MAAEDVLAEGLARLEHKLDLVLEYLARVMGPGTKGFMLTPLGDPQHVCPVCTQSVQYQVDVLKKVVTRKCGCSTGKFAPPDLSQFLPPVTVNKEISYGEPESEDRSDSSSGRGRGPRSR